MMTNPRILVWSTAFHCAGFDLATLSNDHGDLSSQVYRYRFGSDIPFFFRLIWLIRITFAILRRHTRLYSPDSDCGITRYLAMISHRLGRESRLYLLPDGYITTRPLNLSYSAVFARPVTADAVIQYLHLSRKSTASQALPTSYANLVALKRPHGMTLSDSLSLARTMLNHAVLTCIDRTANHSRVPQSLRSFHGQIDLWVCCHRSIPQQSLSIILRELRQECLQQSYPPIGVTLLQYNEVDPGCVDALFSLPSTVIWEVWQANPNATLYLVDPTLINSIPTQRWRGDLQRSLCRTRELASRHHFHCASLTTMPDHLSVEAWQRPTSGPGKRHSTSCATDANVS